jgi:hypothetical protein
VTQPSSTNSTAALQRGFRLSGWTINDLWLAAMGVGGELRWRDISDITAGTRPATPTEHDVVATALNDYFVDQGDTHPVVLWDDLTTG